MKNGLPEGNQWHGAGTSVASRPGSFVFLPQVFLIRLRCSLDLQDCRAYQGVLKTGSPLRAELVGAATGVCAGGEYVTGGAGALATGADFTGVAGGFAAGGAGGV